MYQKCLKTGLKSSFSSSSGPFLPEFFPKFGIFTTLFGIFLDLFEVPKMKTTLLHPKKSMRNNAIKI